MNSVAPGTRWVSRSGKHPGSEIVVDHTTDVSVFVTLRKAGESMGTIDSSKTIRIDRAQFEARYAPAGSLTNGTPNGSKAYRRPHVKPARHSETQQPLLANNGIVMTGGTKLNLEILTITPGMAKTWLARGGANRVTSVRRVNKYAAAMQRGEWMLTGEGIKLNEQGQVRDGKHRLEAIVVAGVPIQSLVVRNLEEEAFDVLDSGRPRSTSDVLGYHGFGSRIGLAATARGVILVDKFGRYNVSGKEVDAAVSTPIVLRYVQRHKDVLMDALSCANLLHTNGLAGGVGLWGTIFTLLLRVNREAALLFTETLASGENLERDSPILKLRNRMIADHRIPQGMADREMYVALAIKAWNSWRRGERIQSLVWRGQSNNEAFPVPE